MKNYGNAGLFMKMIGITIACVFLNGLIPLNLFQEKTVSEQIVSFFENLRTVQQEKLYLHLDKPYYAVGEQIWFKGYLVNSSTHVMDMPDHFIYVELINQENKILCRQKIKKNEGGFYGNLLLPPDMEAGEYTLRGYTNWMRNVDSDFFFQKNIHIANTLNNTDTVASAKKRKDVMKNDFSLSFFPEGGHLLTGYRQQIAFKCQRSNGYSGELQGYIVNQNGDTLTQLQSEHDGMGAFSFLPEKGYVYYAIVSSPGCDKKKIQLPQANDSGITLSLNQSAGKIRYQIFSSLPANELSDSLYLIGHTRGSLRLLHLVGKDNLKGVINSSFFSEGISHFLLMDKMGNKLSERLLFIYPEDENRWKVQTDKNKYERREKVKVNIRLDDNSNLPDKGSFSLSITDNHSVSIDSLSDNIYSDLLLVSDLKGFIENPGWYFKEKSRKTLRGLDLLMLTHGWTRFDVTPLISCSFIPDYFLEKGQYISGRILNFFGKEAKEAAIVAIDPANNIVRTLESDEKGYFLLDGLDYCDSTTFVIQARNKKGLAVVDIKMDEETVPEVKNKNLFSDSLFVFNSNYLLSAMEAGGMRIINLDDVVIEGKRTQVAKEKAERVWADYSMTEDMLDKSLSRTAKDLFKQAMAGADISNPLVVIDGMCCWDDNYILETIYPDDMKTFDVYKDQARCKYGSIGKSTPAVVITLKPEAMSRKRKGLALFHSLGYVKPDQFYQPVYDTPEKKVTEKMDIRSTIYWNPDLKIDSLGCANIEFYASDFPSSYYVVIEGVNMKGHLYRYTGELLKNVER